MTPSISSVDDEARFASVGSSRRGIMAFLVGSAVAGLGNGLTFPAGAIYLVRERHLPLSAPSLFFMASAVAGALAPLAAGRWIDRSGPSRVLALGLCAEAAGLLAFSGASSVLVASAAGGLIGSGNGLFFTALTPMLASLATGKSLDRLFMHRHWVINLGGGIGALAGALLLMLAGDGVLRLFFQANAGTALLFAVIISRLHGQRAAGSPERRELNVFPRWNRTQWLVVVAHTLVVFFGFAAFEAVVPLAFVQSNEDTSTALAHTMVGASTLAIILAQHLIGRRAERRCDVFSLKVHALIWGCSAMVGLLAIGREGAWLWGLVAVHGALFGLGECWFAVGFQRLLVRLVSSEELGRFNGVVSALNSLALAVGPAAGLVLLNGVSVHAFWLTLLAAMAATFLLWSSVGRTTALSPTTVAARGA